MNLKIYIDEFKKISGLVCVGIAKTKKCEEILCLNGNVKDITKVIEDLAQITPETILDLRINNFMFKGTTHSLYGFLEQDFLLLLYVENNINYNILKSKVDIFLNDILIST
ncbi:MAG: hypothetical protein ACFFDH_13230 [Promethearchaeota archaeon]